MSLDFDPLVYGAAGVESPQERQERIRSQQAADYNKQQLELYHLSRGSGGSAILPEYLSAAERAAGSRAGATSGALRDYYGTPDQIVRRGADVVAAYKPLLDKGASSAYGLFSGAEEKTGSAAAKPVFAARTALAGTTRAGIMQGVLERLGALRAANAQKGFVGSGSAEQGLALRTQIGGTQAAGAAEAAAALQNEQDRQAIRNRILDLQLQSPELAGALAAQAANFEALPGQIAGQISRAELSPLDYFRIGVGPPAAQTMAPWVDARADAWGQLGSNLGANAGSLARYYANRDLADRYRRGYGGGGGAGAGGGYYPNYEDTSNAGSTDTGSYSDFPDYGGAANFDPNWGEL